MTGFAFFELIYLFFCSGIAYFTKGITGFGNTLVMASLFSFVVPNRLTTPIDLLLSIPTNAILVYRSRKSLSLKLVIPLAATMLLGAIPGTLLLKVGEDKLLKSILGVVIMGIALEMLFRKSSQNEKGRDNPVLFMGLGIFSGLLAGLYGISALLVSAISRHTENREAFRANLCLIFLLDCLTRLVFYVSAGVMNADIIKMSLFVTPAVLLGLWAGIRLDKKLNESAVKKSVIGLLFISGATLLIKNLL